LTHPYVVKRQKEKDRSIERDREKERGIERGRDRDREREREKGDLHCTIPSVGASHWLCPSFGFAFS
jgi:hypothetical protein